MGKFNEEDLIKVIEYLKLAHTHMSNYLGGENKRGLLTDISNQKLRIKNYIEYKGYDKTIIDDVWNKKRVD